ncbi:MAG: T9SS type A sorting domain-containing protein [Candidatus Kapabacteria bacterium]|nr:T9SS type A sorting domain-containing protein [Ignavibacteriota bacterium]MCW5883622.1 T9SS type A sorting domain-containing protein [Candidatus Kapabacteria bacterium]
MLPQVTMGEINPNSIKQSYSFIENKGQWDSDVLFLAKSNSLRVWITKKSMVFEQFEVETTSEIDRNSMQNKEIKAYAIALEFQKSKIPDFEKIGEGKTKLNYFVGNDKSKHKTGVMQYEEVMLKGIYDGIDMRYYFDDGEVRYDYIVQPYADPTQIELEIKGAQENKLENGELVMKTSLKPVVKQGLYAYQKNSDDSKQTVNSSFVLTGNKLKLNIGEYDKSKVLVIDPLTMAESYIITNSGSPEYLYDMVLDANGDIYFCGHVFDERFPNAGAFNGGTDVIIGKIHSDLTGYDWMTLFGGEETECAAAIEVDDDYIYIVGRTGSDETSFPLLHPIFDEYTYFIHGSNILQNNFFAVFGKTDRNLKFSTYLSTAVDVSGNPDIKVSSSGKVYITGTFFNKDQDPAYYQLNEITTQTIFGNYSGFGFIVGLEPEFNPHFHYDLMFSSIFCGDGSTTIEAIDIDEDNYIYITGNTCSSSSSFDISHGAYISNKPINTEMGFITKLRYNSMENQNLQILYNSYTGEVLPDYCIMGSHIGAKCIMVKNGTIHIGGSVRTDGIEKTTNAYDTTYSTTQTVYDPFEAFVQVFEPNGNLYNLSYSSYFGGTGSSVITSLDYDDECNSILFAGNTTTAIESSDYYGADIMLPFVSPNSIMVGSINTNLTSTNTLTKLAYIYSDADWNTGETIKFNQSENLIYLAGNKRITTSDQDMAFYTLNKRPCTIAQNCNCGMLYNPDEWLTFGNEEEPITPEDTVCLINLSLDIPPPYDACFSHFKIVVNNLIGGEIINSEIMSIHHFHTYVNQYSLRFGEETVVVLTLFRHEDDNEPCIINKIYKCPCDCPEEMEDWFTMTIGPMPDSCETDCYVQHNLNIPEHFDCFQFYYYSNPLQGIEAGEEPYCLEDEPITQFDGCIGYGEMSVAVITLLRYPGDPDPCILEYFVQCDSNIVIPDWIPLPCDTSCAISYDLDSLTYTSDICPNCIIQVWFRSRVNCEDEQELEVFGIRYWSVECNFCDEEVLFKEAVYRIIKLNPMGFEPVSIGCDLTWRVGIGSCWAWISQFNYTISVEIIRDPTTGFISFDIKIIPHEFKIHKKCDDTDCCSMLIEVCRDLNTDVTITPIWGPDEWQECDPHMIFDIWGRGYLCYPKCDWFYEWYPPLIEPKDDNFINHLNHSVNQQNNYISSIKDESVLKNTEATIIIYDLIGRQVLSRQITITNNATESILSISDLNSGVYRYVIMIDGKVVKSDKIIITK